MKYFTYLMGTGTFLMMAQHYTGYPIEPLMIGAVLGAFGMFAYNLDKE